MIKIQQAGRSGFIRTDSINKDARSVEAVLVQEGSRDALELNLRGRIPTVLHIGGMTFPEQIPLLDRHLGHALGSTDDVHGSVRRIRRKKMAIEGTIIFADDPESDRRWVLARGGHISRVQLGYRAVEWTDIAPHKTATIAGGRYVAGPKGLRIVTQSEAVELSLTPV